VYAQGAGDPDSPDGDDAGTEGDYLHGIYIADSANVDRLDPEHRGLPAIVGGGGASGVIESWRGCYNDNIDDSGNFVNTC